MQEAGVQGSREAGKQEHGPTGLITSITGPTGHIDSITGPTGIITSVTGLRALLPVLLALRALLTYHGPTGLINLLWPYGPYYQYYWPYGPY